MGNATKSKRRTIRTKSINPFRKSGWNSMNKALRLI
jgi:hypothetical protein